jgi:23S rRNA (uracil1939-C5)-methyltransferase
MSCPETINLRIEKMVQGGLGFARHSGQACLVKYAITGELVKASVDHRHKQFLEATVVDILEPSSERVQPPCPLFYTCGGCHLQHMSYSQQLASKAQALDDSLQRIGKFSDLEIPAPIASPAQLHYRIKAGLKVHLQPDVRIGLYEEKTHELIAIERCLLLDERLNAALPLLHELYREKPLVKAQVQFIDMLLCRDSDTVLLRAWSSPRKTRMFSLSLQTGRLSAYSHEAQENVRDMRFLRTPEAFCQINPQQNDAMIGVVLDFLAPDSSRRILDLYCGSGNFSLFLARSGADVFGIEMNPAAVEQARLNARANAISGCRFETADITTLRLTKLPFRCTDVLVNPPRSGCAAAVIGQILKLRPRSIVYVSCNASTLSRDARLLCNGGYRVDTLQPLDMFPQTCHSETVVKFSRST